MVRLLAREPFQMKESFHSIQLSRRTRQSRVFHFAGCCTTSNRCILSKGVFCSQHAYDGPSRADCHGAQTGSLQLHFAGDWRARHGSTSSTKHTYWRIGCTTGTGKWLPVAEFFRVRIVGEFEWSGRLVDRVNYSLSAYC